MLSPSPKGVLRAAVILCLIGCGASAIYETSHVGPGFNRLGTTHDSAIFFFLALWLFALFYGEYRAAESLGKRELNTALGQVQAVGCLVILIYGIWAVFHAHGTDANAIPVGIPATYRTQETAASTVRGESDYRALIVMLVFGHVAFLGNVIWSQIRGDRVFTKTSADSKKGAIKLGWPSSPAAIFGVAAAFFAVMGIVFVKTSILSNRLPMVQDGQTVHVLAGYFVLWVAAPFATFALIYAGVELLARRSFQEFATRIHFVCTLFAVLDVVRIYESWAATTGNMQRTVVTPYSFGGAIAFLGLASVAFAWNLFTSKPGTQVAR